MDKQQLKLVAFCLEHPRIHEHGSRYFADVYPDAGIFIGEDTDWDFYIDQKDQDVINQLVETYGMKMTSDPRYSPFDDLTSAVLSKDNVQVIVRTDARLYKRVLESIPGDVFRESLWKRGPARPSKDTIRRLMNTMFAIAQS